MNATAIVPKVHTTRNGTPYLQSSGVALLAMPSFYPNAVGPFIAGFGEFSADEYINDFFEKSDRTKFSLPDGEALCKVAGQICYLSFGENRSKNADAKKYFDNIKSSAHGSVLEHASYSLLFWGIDRAVTHEIVRHRAGMAYSQVSQRFVDGKCLRFVERPEYQADPDLHRMFESRIDLASDNYDVLAAHLKATIKTDGLSKTDARKRINQTARSGLPNETEAPIVVTGNGRSWRHFIEMRGSEHADATIADLALNTFRVLRSVAPILFDDYEEHVNGVTNRISISTKYRKV